MNPISLPGFDANVQNQLNDLVLDSQSQTSRASDPSSQSRSQSNHYTTHIHPRTMPYTQNRPGYRHPPQSSSNVDDFPVLGSSRPVSTLPHVWNSPESTSLGSQARQGQQQDAAQRFFSNARGGGRGSSRDHSQGWMTPQSSTSSNQRFQPNGYNRPNTRNHTLFNPQAAASFGTLDQQRTNRQRSIEQSDYLEHMIKIALKNGLSKDEIEAKQTFRLRLQEIARDLFASKGAVISPGLELSLESYGSLSNSFGMAGCDVDLLMTLKDKKNFEEIPDSFKRDLERALLDKGIGARLLTKTRVPILRVCENPSPELLKGLRAHRAQFDKEEIEKLLPRKTSDRGFEGLPDLSQEQQEVASRSEFDDAASEVQLPPSPIIEPTPIEFTDDCGIQCDVNFSNRIALRNTKLLWTYGQWDQRVRKIGIFVKSWAKARDINTPYRGTLSSYGYVLMVLHFLMNVAHPPVIPNLQQLQYQEDINGWGSVDLFEGLDARFMQDSAKLAQVRQQMRPNTQSTAALLAHFFRYYGRYNGFRWKEDIVSIRSPGGIIKKSDKGWTEAKWAAQQSTVRLRYLCAIEDPFELDHNVARTVGHNGIVTIRDEFRRACEIIDNIHREGTGPSATFSWLKPDGSTRGDGSDLTSIADHGDSLKKDKEARQEKFRKMKAELEEKQLKAIQDNLELDASISIGTLSDVDEPVSPDPATTAMKLIHDQQYQAEKVNRLRGSGADKLVVEEDSEDEEPSFSHSQNESQYRQRVTPDAMVFSHNSTYIESEATNEVHERYAILPDNRSASTPRSRDEIHSQNNPIWNAGTNSLPRRNSPQAALDAIVIWNQNTVGGRFLNMRDNKIRQSTWIPPTHGEGAQLSNCFPYDPDMSQDELNRKNEMLELFYKDSMRKRVPIQFRRSESLNTPKLEGNGDANNTVSTSITSSKTQHMISNARIGGVIQWNSETDAGRWLLWRDRKISRGVWTCPSKGWRGIHEQLDLLFPHSTDMTLGQLEAYNEELARFFSELEMPRPPPRMTIAQSDQCGDYMLGAIENLKASRGQPYAKGIEEPAMKLNLVLGAIYNPQDNDVSPRTDKNGICPSASKSNRSWTRSNSVGNWLNWRDGATKKGLFDTSRQGQNSVFTELTELYPFDEDVSTQDRSRQNAEIDQCFMGLHLPSPRYPTHSTSAIFRAIIQVTKARKEHQHKEDKQGLLRLFTTPGLETEEQKNQTSTNTVEKPLEFVSDRSILPNENRAYNVVKPEVIQDTNASDFVRAQRLAFFAKQVGS